MIDSGKWVTEVEELKNMVIAYYSLFFQADPNCNKATNDGINFPSLSEENSRSLNAPFLPKEITQALFEMAPFKAPGQDGIPVGFYQKMWPLLGNSMCEFALSFFSSGELPKGTNDTLLTLILKVPNLKLVMHFRPISLSNVSYKILTKTMTNV